MEIQCLNTVKFNIVISTKKNLIWDWNSSAFASLIFPTRSDQIRIKKDFLMNYLRKNRSRVFQRNNNIYLCSNAQKYNFFQSKNISLVPYFIPAFICILNWQGSSFIVSLMPLQLSNAVFISTEFIQISKWLEKTRFFYVLGLVSSKL